MKNLKYTGQGFLKLLNLKVFDLICYLIQKVSLFAQSETGILPLHV